MQKTLMVLGAGFPQKKLIEAAKDLGYRTIVASIPGNYPGFEVADKTVYADITKPEEVYEAAKREKIDGIATCCLDTGIRALGYVCDRMHLPGLKENSAICCNEKSRLKEVLVKNQVNTAKYFRISSEKELKEAVETLHFPVVLKAVDLQGSNGVFICHSYAELMEAYGEVFRLSRMNYCILEEYISGNELGAQAFVYQGRILFILPHGDNTHMSKTAIPVGHYMPLDMDEERKQAVILECEKAIRAVGLDNCAVNIDLIERDGTVYLIELTGRAGATCLPELVSIYYGIDYYKMIAYTAMGGDAEAFFEKKKEGKTACAARMLLSEKTGIVRTISFEPDLLQNPDLCDFSLIISEGDMVKEFTSAKDRIGQIIVKGDNYPACEKTIQELIRKIHVTLDVMR